MICFGYDTFRKSGQRFLSIDTQHRVIEEPTEPLMMVFHVKSVLRTQHLTNNESSG